MSRGRRYETEGKLNYQKVFAVIIAIIVIAMVVMIIKNVFIQREKLNKEYEYFTAFSADKWGVINQDGETVINPSYQEMIVIPDKTKDVFICTYDINEEDGTYKTKALNRKNEEIFTQYDQIQVLENIDENDNIWYEKNVLKVMQNGKYGLIDLNGKKLLDCEYDEISAMKGIENSLLIRKDGYVGLANNAGTILIDVKYSDIKEDKIVNSATAKLALENKEEETTDETETEVYKGTVVATYKTDKGVKLHDDVETTDFAGTNYTTETKSFYGYTLREIPSNKEGTYIANETIQVDYVYIKNEGTVTENKVNKVQNNTITDINSEYNYVLSYTGKVEDYVGEVTLELTDTLPYNAEIKSKDNKCVVNGRTIVCTDVYTVDKEHQVINAAFNIVLRYTNVGSEVKNIVNSKLIYGDKNVTDKDEVIDVVPSGTVVATYKTDKGVTLSNNVTTTDLVGKEYTTEAKEFFGYTLKEIPSNKNGLYTKNPNSLPFDTEFGLWWSIAGSNR